MKKATVKNLVVHLTTSIVTIIILAACLCVTSFVLIHATLTSRGNLFSTGTVKINLNGGETILREDEFLMDSGMGIEKDFYVENLSDCGVWYRLYFEHVEGELSQYLDVKILDQETILASGKMFELTREKVSAYDQPLESGEKKILTLSLQLPEDVGNEAMGQFLIFDFGIEAVQTRNNPDKKFD